MLILSNEDVEALLTMSDCARYTGLVLLFSTDTGEPLAIYAQRMRPRMSSARAGSNQACTWAAFVARSSNRVQCDGLVHRRRGAVIASGMVLRLPMLPAYTRRTSRNAVTVKEEVSE